MGSKTVQVAGHQYEAWRLNSGVRLIDINNGGDSLDSSPVKIPSSMRMRFIPTNKSWSISNATVAYFIHLRAADYAATSMPGAQNK